MSRTKERARDSPSTSDSRAEEGAVPDLHERGRLREVKYVSLVLAKAEVPMVLTAGPTLSVPLFNDLAAGGSWPLLLQRVLRVCLLSTAGMALTTSAAASGRVLPCWLRCRYVAEGAVQLRGLLGRLRANRPVHESPRRLFWSR